MNKSLVGILILSSFWLGFFLVDFFEINLFWNDGVKPEIKTSFCQRWGFDDFQTHQYNNGIYFDECFESMNGYRYIKEFKCQSDGYCRFLVELSSMHKPLETCEFIYGENTIEAQNCYCKESWIEESDCSRYWQEKTSR